MRKVLYMFGLLTDTTLVTLFRGDIQGAMACAVTMRPPRPFEFSKQTLTIPRKVWAMLYRSL
jgi:hypothetical protein